MAAESNIEGNKNIVIQDVNESTITITVNGETKKISNQLEELKAILLELKMQKIQFEGVLYSIESITDNNFRFLRKTFNEYLAREIFNSINAYVSEAKNFSNSLSTITNWESQSRFRNIVFAIISESFVGVIGVQISKLIAIGKEEFSENKHFKYIEKCLYIIKVSLDLINFALISKFWDAHKADRKTLTIAQSQIINSRLNNEVEQSIDEHFQLFKTLLDIYSTNENKLMLPIKELEEFKSKFSEEKEFFELSSKLKPLEQKLDNTQYNLLDCFEAEVQLVSFLKHFNFLVKYQMVSIKDIDFKQSRNADPRYLHEYESIRYISNQDGGGNVKFNYTTQTVYTDAVLLFRGDNYQDSINLFPFIIDYNALTFEAKAKIYFYQCRNLRNNKLEYRFTEDNSILQLENKGFLKPDSNYNELMSKIENRKILNLDYVVSQLCEAGQCLSLNKVQEDPS